MSNPTQTTITENIEWFKDNDRYMEVQSRLEHYRHTRRIVEREVRGVKRLLDVGNGGFFNYDTTSPEHTTAVDLFFKDGPGTHPNTTLRKGSLLDLPFSDESFDCVLLQNVFHHVTGRTVAENHQNLRRGLHEIYRCLESQGKAVIIESTVGSLFYILEKLLFTVALAVKRRGHPVTFQFTARELIGAALAAGFTLDEFSYVPRGTYVLQFGHKWPSVLTPARAVKLILKKHIRD